MAGGIYTFSGKGSAKNLIYQASIFTQLYTLQVSILGVGAVVYLAEVFHPGTSSRYKQLMLIENVSVPASVAARAGTAAFV